VLALLSLTRASCTAPTPCGTRESRAATTLCSLTNSALSLPFDPPVRLTHRLHTEFHPSQVTGCIRTFTPAKSAACPSGGSRSRRWCAWRRTTAAAKAEAKGGGQGGGQGRSSLRIWLADTDLEHVVTPPPHHFLVWAGKMPHSGGAYAALNVRCFAYVDQREHARVAYTTYPIPSSQRVLLTGRKRPAAAVEEEEASS
jgi:hypothetical protein